MVVTLNQIQDISAEAYSLGFSLLGVANIKAPTHSEKFLHWLDNENAADLVYLKRHDAVQKRINPEQLVPGSSSVITLGYPYAKVEHEKLSNSTIEGWISSYALFEDYHLYFNKLGMIFSQSLDKIFPGNHFFRVFTDSAPIFERGFAASTGLGWIGKNSNLISQIFGSYFLLAEVFTDLEIDTYSVTNADRCGECHRCIDHCPTHCILPDRTIDAGKCISYLTIENKNNIPRDLRSQIGKWVFGCDTCQSVCPWNQKIIDSVNSPNKILSPLVELLPNLSFSEEEFQAFYASTPILRVKWSGFLRNLIVSAGNSKDPVFESILSHHLRASSIPMIRLHAAWALGNLNTSTARNALIAQKKIESDPGVLAEIAYSIEK